MVNRFSKEKRADLKNWRMYIDYVHFHAQHQQLLLWGKSNELL